MPKINPYEFAARAFRKYKKLSPDKMDVLLGNLSARVNLKNQTLEIIRDLVLTKKTEAAIARDYDLSRERIRQLKKAAGLSESRAFIKRQIRAEIENLLRSAPGMPHKKISSKLSGKFGVPINVSTVVNIAAKHGIRRRR